jgi:hypothetical protein
VITGAFNIVKAYIKTVTARNIQYAFGEKTTFQNHAEFSFVMLL